MYPRPDIWLIGELRLDPIFQLLIVPSDFFFLLCFSFQLTTALSTHFSPSRNLDMLLAGLLSPFWTFCHDCILIILPQISYSNSLFLIHFHIQSLTLCSHQWSIGFQEPCHWSYCFLFIPFCNPLTCWTALKILNSKTHTCLFNCPAALLRNLCVSFPRDEVIAFIICSQFTFSDSSWITFLFPSR